MKQLWVMVSTNSGWCYEDVLIDVSDLTSKAQMCAENGGWGESRQINAKDFLKYLMHGKSPKCTWLEDCKFELAAEWED